VSHRQGYDLVRAELLGDDSHGCNYEIDCI
jgi:hypothetical protein